MNGALFLVAIALSSAAFADSRPSVKLDDLNGQTDTSIVIKKGDVLTAPPGTEYQIIDGKDDLAGDPELERNRALVNWRNACRDWKQTLEKLNKENRMLALHCGAPKSEKEGDAWVYRSTGTYKLKVKIRERAS